MAARTTPRLAWSLERILALSFLGVAAVAAIALVLVVRTWREAEAGERSVAHTLDVEAHLHAVQALVTRGGWGIRGFLLTGEDAYLGGYDRTRRDMADVLARLRRLTADNPGQQARLTTVEVLTARQAEAQDELLRVVRGEGLEAARRRFQAGATVAATQAVMDEIERMVAEEERHLRERQATSAARRRRAVNTLGLLGALTAAVLAASFLLAGRNLAERKRAEDERDNFFTLALDMLCIAGVDGRFKRLNPAFSETLGYTIEELLERPFLDFVHPDDQEATLREVATLSQGRPTVHFENRYRCKDGSWRWLSWKSTPEPGGLIFATARDVTARKQAEDDLRHLNLQLATANRELEAFAYSVSHDLRQPLRAIDGFSQVLLDDHGASLDGEAQGHLARIRAAAQRMGALIDDLLKLSRITRAELVKEPVDLSGLVSAVMESRRDASRTSVLEVQPGLRVDADPRLLRVALDNLVGNALKFSRDAAEARVVFGRREEQGEAVYFVRDNGAGFDMAYADKLFAPFQRLHSPGQFEGTGIGLAIVARVVQRHGGRVWAHSAPGQGATFSFTLPAAAGEEAG
jgi:PAS domain S-box-containing protein